MRPSITALALALVAGPAAAATDALRQPPTAEGVTAAEAAWIGTLKARDVAALGRLLEPDFVDTTWQGARRDRAAALAAAAAGGSGAQDVSDLTVSLYGTTAVARGLNTVRGADGAVMAHIRFTDVFVYRDGGWRAVSAQETLEQAAK